MYLNYIVTKLINLLILGIIAMFKQK